MWIHEEGEMTLKNDIEDKRGFLGWDSNDGFFMQNQ